MKTAALQKVSGLMVERNQYIQIYFKANQFGAKIS